MVFKVYKTNKQYVVLWKSSGRNCKTGWFVVTPFYLQARFSPKLEIKKIWGYFIALSASRHLIWVIKSNLTFLFLFFLLNLWGDTSDLGRVKIIPAVMKSGTFWQQKVLSITIILTRRWREKGHWAPDQYGTNDKSKSRQLEG